jgi:hypothetical protein
MKLAQPKRTKKLTKSAHVLKLKQIKLFGLLRIILKIEKYEAWQGV